MDRDRLRALLSGKPVGAEALGCLFAEDVHLRIGSASPAIGKVLAIAELGRLLDRIAWLGGRFYQEWQVDETCFVETEITYSDPDGRAVIMPCVVIVRPHKGPVEDIRFYLDPTSLPVIRPH